MATARAQGGHDIKRDRGRWMPAWWLWSPLPNLWPRRAHRVATISNEMVAVGCLLDGCDRLHWTGAIGVRSELLHISFPVVPLLPTAPPPLAPPAAPPPSSPSLPTWRCTGWAPAWPPRRPARGRSGGAPGVRRGYPDSPPAVAASRHGRPPPWGRHAAAGSRECRIWSVAGLAGRDGPDDDGASPLPLPGCACARFPFLSLSLPLHELFWC